MEICENCGRGWNLMKALGHWPRCQHNFEGRAFDPNSQCVLKARHKGCHKAEYPGQVDHWTCAD